MNRTGALAPPITEMLGAGIGVIILYLGGRDIVRGAGMEGAQFLMFLIGLFALMQPIRALSQVNIQIEEGIAASERIFKILDTPPTVRDAPRARSLAPPVREIRFEDVSFEHVPGVPVLRDIRFDVQAGEMIAIVGLSGAGKSTLIDLLPRFYDPDAGRILINGEDIRVVRLESLRSMIGLVTQETVLFDDTVEANIALGKPGATHEEIVRASEAANAHRFIREMPQGYATPIGDRGVKLSGGQRQRLAIARAILRDPPILVLDEATSALDSESEALVQEAVERLLRNRTTFVIAHRLSTVQEADRILVLDRGRIEDEGTHDELLARDGLYQRLYRMQFRDATAERSSAPTRSPQHSASLRPLHPLMTRSFATTGRRFGPRIALLPRSPLRGGASTPNASSSANSISLSSTRRIICATRRTMVVRCVRKPWSETSTPCSPGPSFGAPRSPDRIFDDDRGVNLGPRVGVAYNPDGRGRMVINGGWGMMFQSLDTQNFETSIGMISGVPASRTFSAVEAAALGLRNLGIKTAVVSDAVRAVAADTERQAIEEMRQAGVEFSSVDQVLGAYAA